MISAVTAIRKAAEHARKNNGNKANTAFIIEYDCLHPFTKTSSDQRTYKI
jgi:hypothetical protein